MNSNPSTQSSSDSSTISGTDVADIEKRELDLKEKELLLREKEIKAKIELEKRGIWVTSPLLIALASAIFGLIGTGVGAALQGYSNLQLERQKSDTNFQLERQEFEFNLIQKALDIQDRNEAAKQLIFLVDSGVIQSLDSEKIRKLAEDPNQLPISRGIKLLRRDAIQGCVVTIRNSLVSLMSQPDVFSNEIIKVSSGEYKATEYVITSFGGIREINWFQIELEGRKGWIRNDTWTIDTKTSACP